MSMNMTGLIGLAAIGLAAAASGQGSGVGV